MKNAIQTISIIAVICGLALAGCDLGDGKKKKSSTGSCATDATYSTADICTAWILNTDGETSVEMTETPLAMASCIAPDIPSRSDVMTRTSTASIKGAMLCW